MKIEVLNQTGNKVEDIQLNDEVFGVEPHSQAMFNAVQVYNSNLRQATAKTKKRDEVRGGGRKPWRQKGTARARQGSTRSPQWRGGGIVFGPTGEQNFKLDQNRKEARLALKSALSLKNAEKSIILVDEIKTQGKTKELLKVLEDLKASGKTLIVASENSTTYETLLSSSNLPNVAVVFADKFEFNDENGVAEKYYDLGINVYDLLNSNTVIMTVAAAKNIEEVLA